MGARRSRNDGDCSAVRDGIVAAIPSLRAFAVSLSGNLDRADDLVQDTIVRALANIRSFQPGTNLMAWLFTILRNHRRSERRKSWREIEDRDGYFAEGLKTLPEQDGHVEFEELRRALASLTGDQREALVLVGAAGVPYGEAAKICDCAVGTIKSRGHRGRLRLAELMAVDGAHDFSLDQINRAVLTANDNRGTQWN
jgi:RNA polymerase sigma-70 factor (ECF subfamily)